MLISFLLLKVKDETRFFYGMTTEIKNAMQLTSNEVIATGKLTQFQTKVKVISIMDKIISTLCSLGYRDLCFRPNIGDKSAFLMQMLKSKQEIWIQQTSDFSALLKDLLLAVDLEVKAEESKQSTQTKLFNSRRTASQELGIIDHQVSVSYHLFKDSWRKCIKCQVTTFFSLGSPAECKLCKSVFAPKPEFTQ
jgi:hypothetical protein